jgi:hypothetical protein
MMIGSANDTGVPQGSLTKESIDRVIRANAGKIRMCYQRVLNDHPNLNGKVIVHFKINKDGLVHGARIQSTTLKHSKVENCILGEIRLLKFPSSETESTVNYPFIFSQGG